MAGNYDKQVLLSRALFLNYDQQEIIDRYRLDADEDYIYLPLLNRMYRISRKDGVVESQIPSSDKNTPMTTNSNVSCSDNPCTYKECLDFNVVMTLYDVLCYPAGTPLLSHQWVPLANLQMTSSPSADIFTQKYATAFSGKTDLLWDVCQEIGGRRPKVMAGADVCWEFDFFPFFPIQFRYWDKDEEFPAQIRLLWDKNALKFMHFETIYYAMHVLLEIIKCYLPITSS